MLGVSGQPVGFDNMILPMEGHGVKVISMGFFVPEETPVIWRGPMLHKAVEQFLGHVYWGELDFLLVDLPPGTGDVSISLASFLPGAQMLVVTTPQEAARKVAERAGKMAERTNLRPIGVIENMSFFVLARTAASARAIFRRGRRPGAAETLGVPLLGQIPIAPGAPRRRRLRRSDRGVGAARAGEHRDARGGRAGGAPAKTRVGKPLNLRATRAARG